VNTESKSPCVIRPADSSDAAGCLALYAPFVRDTAVSFETEVPTIAETVRDFPWLVAESAGAVIAYAYARRHRERPSYRWSAEVSVYVARESRRRGIARDLYSTLLDVLRRQGYANAYAGIALPNPASVAFHESMGFEPVGIYKKVGFKLGRWHDVGWWSLRLTDATAPPVEPVPYHTLRGR
jgi:L-amino acid N-acyltransferase YncA